MPSTPQAEPILSEECLVGVRSLFGPSEIEGRHLFRVRLEAAASELARLLSIDPFLLKAVSTTRARLLVSAATYAGRRLNDLLLRQSFISWLRREFAQHGQHPSGIWRVFAALAIKDFHSDASSLMDAVAPVAILIDADIKKEDRKKLPGFPDIQGGTQRSYRKRLQHDVLTIVDDTERWWPFVKQIRDLSMHRRHERLVFGRPEDGFLFQIYEGDKPLVTQLPFAHSGTDVADFQRYAAWVTAEIVCVLDRLAVVIAARLSFTKEILDNGGRVGDFSEFLDALSDLIRLTGVLSNLNNDGGGGR